MHLGKDFWKILNILRFVLRIIDWIARDVNEDTPKGETGEPKGPVAGA